MAMNVKCSFCGTKLQRKPSVAKKNKNNFCNIECKSKWMKNRKPWNFKGKVSANCDICGKEFFRLKSKIGTNKFCSRDCYFEYKRKQTGELHPLYKRVEVICEICGKAFEKSTYRLNRAKHHFCSIECKRKWEDKIDVFCDWCGKKIKMSKSMADYRPTHFCSKTCFKKAGRVRTLNYLNEFSGETLPEKLVRKYLTSKKINFKQHYTMFQKFNVDFLIPCNPPFEGIVIEVLGDYYHCHPLKYPTPISYVQKQALRRDKSRFAYLTKCNYLVFGIWECDIKEDIIFALKPVTDYLEYGKVSSRSRFEHLRGGE